MEKQSSIEGERPTGTDYVAVYQSNDDQWRWRMKSKNGRMVSQGSHPHGTPADAKRAFVGARQIAAGKVGRAVMEALSWHKVSYRQKSGRLTCLYHWAAL